ncbi:hypothetical protein Val02_85300 [Virgisporangium aliadipatigenens]|uniref:Uncharacterized protein n=1 Tax=Virgisporangium aliadipatigenens TaxID=741659 RepID=A0A8J3YU13_9ACTN|nr:hypothetical protein [Virgisporangium aliadipatigenens]GIJ51644.1 hypothetical protein Val02_85300 [Virgisporangium aliadipatigenens]
MPIINVPLDVPEDIFVGLETGELTRYGGVVRDAAGAIVKHLQDGLFPEDAAGKAAGGKGSRIVVASLAVAAVTAAGVAVYKVVASRKQSAEVPECVRKFTVSLGAYLDAARAGTLGADDVELLIADLDAVGAESDSGRIVVDFTVDRWQELTRLVAEHTRKLAMANNIGTNDLHELSHSAGDNVIVDLRRHLEGQGRIFKNVA